MLREGEGCITYLCKECGNQVNLDPGDSCHPGVCGCGVKIDSPQQRHSAQTPSPTTKPISLNQRHEIIPSISSTVNSAISNSKRAYINKKRHQGKYRKILKTIDSFTKQLRKLDQTPNLEEKISNLNEQPSCKNEGLKLLYDISNSNSFLNENKHMFDCSVIPQFKCKLCDQYVLYDQNHQKMINNLETHLKLHCTNPQEISPSLLTDMLNCLPLPFRSTKCLAISPIGLIKCSICNCNLPATAKEMCEHLTSNIHNFRSKPAISVPRRPKKSVKICFQLNEENGICLTCCSTVNISEMSTHNHISAKELDKTTIHEVLPLKIRRFDCFYKHQKKLKCNICDTVVSVLPHLLYEHVLGKNHNKKLHHNLLKELSTNQFKCAKGILIAASTHTVYCLICGFELQVSEIKTHLADSSHGNTELSLNRILDELPFEYRNATCLQQIKGQVTCQLCKQKVPSSALHLHHHFLTPTHSNNIVKSKINSLNDGAKQVKWLAQFHPNIVLCLICHKKLHPTEIMLHEHLLGNCSDVINTSALIRCFSNTLKSLRCLIQTEDQKVFCSICSGIVPFSIGNLLEHILGDSHNRKMFNQCGKSFDKITDMKQIIQCDTNELLCLDCNVKFPMNIDAILNHTKQPHSHTSGTLHMLKDIPCLVPDVQNSLLCSVCGCLVPWSVRNVLEHLLGKPHNKKIANLPEKFNCLIQVDKNEVVCLNCNCTMLASSSILNQHISDFHSSNVTPDFSHVISKQLNYNKCLIKTVDNKMSCLVCQQTVPAELTNIQSHLLATNHLTNLRSKTSIINLTGKSASSLLNLNRTDRTIDCFHDILKHTRCLIRTNDNKAICSICSSDVSLNISNLIEHVIGANHNKNIPTGIEQSLVGQSSLQNFIICDKNNLLCLDCNAKFPLNSDALLSHAKQSHSTTSDTLDKFKDIPCLVSYEQNSLFCLICNCMVPRSVRNILEHLLGRIHNNKIMNGAISKTSSYFVQVDKDEAICLNCNCKMSASSESLENHLSEHHNGSSNFPKVISQQFQNNKYLIKTVDDQVTCLLCQFTFPADMKSVQNHLSEISHTNKLSFDASTFLTEEFANVKCLLKTDVAQVMCLVCNCFVPLSSVNLTQHLLGRRHNKLVV